MSDQHHVPSKDLTSDERMFIAGKLLSRARDKTKKLQQAIFKECHPQLIAEIRADIAECTRLAMKLQESVT